MLNLIKILLALVAFAAVLTEAGTLPQPPYRKDEVDKLAAKGLVKLALYKALHPSKNKCTIANAIKRKEWYVRTLVNKMQTDATLKVRYIEEGQDCLY